MNRFVEIGQSMWQMLADTFTHVMRENSAAYQPDKAKVWAGFMSAATGAMARDLSPADAKTILLGVIGALEPLPSQETIPAPAVGMMSHSVVCKCGSVTTSKIENGQMSLSPMVGWYCSTETGWLCPKCSPVSCLNRRESL